MFAVFTSRELPTRAVASSSPGKPRRRIEIIEWPTGPPTYPAPSNGGEPTDPTREHERAAASISLENRGSARKAASRHYADTRVVKVSERCACTVVRASTW